MTSFVALKHKTLEIIILRWNATSHDKPFDVKNFTLSIILRIDMIYVKRNLSFKIFDNETSIFLFSFISAFRYHWNYDNK